MPVTARAATILALGTGQRMSDAAVRTYRIWHGLGRDSCVGRTDPEEERCEEWLALRWPSCRRCAACAPAVRRRAAAAEASDLGEARGARATATASSRRASAGPDRSRGHASGGHDAAARPEVGRRVRHAARSRTRSAPTLRAVGGRRRRDRAAGGHRARGHGHRRRASGRVKGRARVAYRFNC